MGTLPRILILEDNSDISELLSQLLSCMNCEAVIVTTAEEVESALDNGNSYSLALLDIMLPKLDGRDIAKYIRAKSPAFPIYFMTGMNDPEIGSESLSLVDGILRKPFSVKEISEIIQKNAKSRPQKKQKSGRQEQLLAILTSLATDQEEARRLCMRIDKAISTSSLGDSEAAEIRSLLERLGERCDRITEHLSRLGSKPNP